jgi:hypothetical protein
MRSTLPSAEARRRAGDISTKIATLQHMKMPEIWALWDTFFAIRPTRPNRMHLESRLAYKLQEQALGGLPASTIQMLADHGSKYSRIKSDSRLKHGVLPGTILEREFDGRIYRVAVLADGKYEFEGMSYKSLSAIAKRITGTQWSGPVFFGLKGKSL